MLKELAQKSVSQGVTKQEMSAELGDLNKALERMSSRIDLIADQEKDALTTMKHMAGILGDLKANGIHHAASAGGKAAVKALTPAEMLAAGAVCDAVTAVLEMKSCDDLVELLQDLSPSVLIEHCKRIVVLCTTQQLAVDLSTRTPPEGLDVRLDWLKNLVMHVVFNKTTESNEINARKERDYMRAVMESVQEAIETTQSRLQKAQNTGENVPSSAMTDLNLLKNIVQTAGVV